LNKEINFLPERIIRARARKRKGFIFSLLLFLMTAVLAWGITFPFRVMEDYRSRLAAVNRKIEELEPAGPLYERKQMLEEELQVKERTLEEIKNQDFKIIDLLRRINSILPSNSYLTHLSLSEDNRVTVEVVTHNPVETARVQVGLRKTGLFEEVSLAGVGEVPLGEGANPVTFTLELDSSFIEESKEKELEFQSNNMEKKIQDELK
jgi:hypothetical protein